MKNQKLLCVHEEVAVAMAHGYAKVTNRPACVILHNLVGLQHSIMSFWNAYADRVPMIVLGGSGPLDPAERRFIDWLHSANNQSQIMQPYTKWTDEPPTQQAVLNSLAKAYRSACTAPMGLTYLSIDTSLQEGAIEKGLEAPDIALPRYSDIPPIAAAEYSIKAAADLFIEANTPSYIRRTLWAAERNYRSIKRTCRADRFCFSGRQRCCQFGHRSPTKFNRWLWRQQRNKNTK